MSCYDEPLDHEPQDPHPCPFKSEINNDPDSLCTCSTAQQCECAMDI